MKTIILGAFALAFSTAFASAQQYYTTSYYAVPVYQAQPQVHLHNYSPTQGNYAPLPYAQPQTVYGAPQPGYIQPRAAYIQPQTIYVNRPHHAPNNLTGYWPFISKPHADRDFQRNWIHVYGGN